MIRTTSTLSHQLQSGTTAQHKVTPVLPLEALPAYTDVELQFQGVEIIEVFLTTEDNDKINILQTFTDWTEVRLPTGTVFGQDDPAFSPGTLTHYLVLM